MTPSPRTPRLAAMTLLLAATMTIMAGATIAPSLPGMVAHFGEDAELGVRLLLTITALAIALAAPVAGWLGDAVSRLRTLWASVALYVVAGSAGLILENLTLLLASRILLGVAVAGVMTSVAALIGDLYRGPDRDRMLGLQGAAMGFGGVVFLGLGGLLADIHWRGPFAIYLLPVALLILIPLALPRLRDEGDPVAGDSPQTGVALPTSVLASLLAAAFLAMVGFYAVPVQLPFLLAERGGDNPVLAGMAMAGLTLVSAVVGMVYGGLSERLSTPALACAAFGGIASGLFLIASGPVLLWSGLVLIGLGMGLLMPSLSRWLLALAPPARRGRIMGGLTTAIFAGQFASPLVLAPVIAASGLDQGFATAGALSACALVFILFAARTGGPAEVST